MIAGALLFVREQFDLSPLAQGVVVSAMLLGAAAGSAIAGRVGDRFGRRSSVMAAAITFVFGALVRAVAPSTAMLVLGRVLAGIGVGMASTSAPVYISEVAPERLRGALLTMLQLAVTSGILASFLVALVLEPGGDWRLMLALSAIPGVVLAVGMWLVPPSPRWLVERGLLRPGIRVALVVGVGLALLQQATGINAVLYYAPTIFQSAGFESESSAILAGVGLGVVNLMFTIVAIRYIERRVVRLAFGGPGRGTTDLALGRSEDCRDAVAVSAAVGP